MRNPKSWGRFTTDFPEEFYLLNIAEILRMQKSVRTFVKSSKLNKNRIAEARSSIRKEFISKLDRNISKSNYSSLVEHGNDPD